MFLPKLIASLISFSMLLICSLSGFQCFKIYMESLVAARHLRTSVALPQDTVLTSRLSGAIALGAHELLSPSVHGCLTCMAFLYHMDQMVQKLHLGDLGPKDI